MERYGYISGHFCVLLELSSVVILLCCSVRFGYLVEDIQSFEKRIRLPVLLRVLPERALVLRKRNRRKQ